VQKYLRISDYKKNYLTNESVCSDFLNSSEKKIRLSFSKAESKLFKASKSLLVFYDFFLMIKEFFFILYLFKKLPSRLEWQNK
jgi:hypothetical protein